MGDAVPVLVFEAEHVEALVVKSRLEAEGIEVLFDDLRFWGPGSPGHLYVAPADAAAARWVIAACQQQAVEPEAGEPTP